jgi:hypothetical protein
MITAGQSHLISLQSQNSIVVVDFPITYLPFHENPTHPQASFPFKGKERECGKSKKRDAMTLCF